MVKIFEEKDSWRIEVAGHNDFDKIHVKLLAGVQIASGRVKGSERWEIQGYTFPKQGFRTAEDCCLWLNAHLKGEIQTCLDFKSWNEYRRRAMNAFVHTAEVFSNDENR